MNIIRKATIEDSPLILEFIRQLAIYEKLEHQLENTVTSIEKWIFEEKKAEVIFLMVDDKEVGFALYFYNYSTFVGKPGLYIEDIFILPEYRKMGLGKKVLSYLAQKALEEGCGRMEWVCLDWNETSINFYQSLEAKPLSDWIIFRLTEDKIKKLAKK